MRIQDKCIPCTVNQAIKVADMVGLEDKSELLRKVFSYLSEVDYKGSSTPELIGEIFALLKEETGNEDPYKETREHYNKMFLERLLELEQEIGKANNLLYLGDNCGEICFDKILVKRMKKMNPQCHIYFETRGKAVVNDSVEADAYAVGMDEYATIISNGDSSLGTVLYRTSEEFQQVYQKADIVIAKGQANYECLSEESKNIFFLLMTKCKVIADDIGVPEMQMICMKRR